VGNPDNGGSDLAMMAAVGAAPSLWGEVALAASYLWQFTPSCTLPQGITPAELDRGLKPDISSAVLGPASSREPGQAKPK